MSVEIFDDIEQGTDAWLKLRVGIPTASCFSSVMARGDGKMRKTLLHRLAGERLTGEPAETYSNNYMNRGKMLEAEARAAYAMLTDKPVRQVGFVKNGFLGCSPDSLVGDDGGLEIKTQKAELMIATLERWSKDPTDYPTEHRWQCMGGMLVSERDWWDLSIYCHRSMPAATFRIKRDPVACAELRGELNRFEDECCALVERIKRMG